MVKKLVLYVFHEYCSNLDFFIQNGLVDDPDVEYIFIHNNLSVNMAKWSFLKNNIRLFIRPNIGHDFQGWNQALFLPSSVLQQKIIYHDRVNYKITAFKDRQPFLYTLFDEIIFINSTVVGPVLPAYLDKKWTDYFTLHLSDEAPLVGISANFLNGGKFCHSGDSIKRRYGIDPPNHAHIQSMCFALNRVGLDLLIKHRLFHPGKQFPKDKNELIATAEIAMSSILRHHKKSIYSFVQGQGHIPWHRVDKSGNVWSGNIPICDTMFSKTRK